MFKFMGYIAAILLVISCGNDKNGNTTKAEQKAPDTNQSSVVNCYQYINAKDTVTLKLIHVGEAITGTLVYNIYEKDKNKGTIQGRMEGDVLIADYTFMSEGVTSVRQVAFKMKGNSFMEGFGEIETAGNKDVFKNTNSLQFNHAIKLVEIGCE